MILCLSPLQLGTTVPEITLTISYQQKIKITQKLFNTLTTGLITAFSHPRSPPHPHPPPKKPFGDFFQACFT